MKLFDKYSYRKKKIVLIVIFFLLCIVSYKQTFSVTYDMLSLREELTKKSGEAENSSLTLKQRQQELLKINYLIGKENVSNDKVQHGFLTFIDSIKSPLTVEEVTEVYKFEHPDFIINTNEITLKGDYISMVSFLYNFETHFDLARLVSTRIFIKKNKEKKTNEVFMTILLQNFSDYD